jgi:hypothetical protein
MKKIYFIGEIHRPGEKVPTSGQYGVGVYDYKTKRLKAGENEIPGIKRKRFPPHRLPKSLISNSVKGIATPKIRVYFLKDKTKHLF